MGEGDSSALLDEATVAAVTQAVDIIWTFFCLVLVTLMQPGFACYEVGAISKMTSIRPILLKNIGDASVSLIAWFGMGYALSSGKDFGGGVGTSYFGLTGDPFAETPEQSSALGYLRCLYQWSFAAACTTIVSGAVADRIPFAAYLIYASLTSALIYPLLAHWVWADEGWASATRSSPLLGCGVIDFAGSGVVHMLGGVIALVLAIAARPRMGRFHYADEWDYDAQKGGSNLKNHSRLGQLREAGFEPNDMSWMTLGGFLLWVGWYGFNCGSTLQISTAESQRAAGRAAMNTTVAAAFGCIFSLIMERVYHIWSPSYRHGDVIDDPLHHQDNKNATPTDKKTKDLIKDHQEADGLEGPWWKPVPWSYSTHENYHGAAVNGVLAGLVGVTAGCATMGYYSAVWVSFVSIFLYHVSYRGILCCRVDDAVGASAIHFVCGAWGLLAAGLTATDEDARLDAGYPSDEECSWHSQARANMIMTVIIFFYGVICAAIIAGIILALQKSDKIDDTETVEKREDHGGILHIERGFQNEGGTADPDSANAGIPPSTEDEEKVAQS